MHIDGLLTGVLENSLLKRVRVKVDPKECINFHLSSYYEGYVLEECDTSVKVLFINTPDHIDPVQNVQKDFVSDAPSPEIKCNIDKLCKLLIARGIEPNHPVLSQLQNLNSMDFVDSYLKQLGFNDTSEIYKQLAFTTESVLDIAKNMGKTLVSKPVVADVVGKVGRTLGTHLPGLIAGKKSIFNRMANFLKTLDINELINLKDIKWFESVGPVKGSLLYVNGVPNAKSYFDVKENPYSIIGRNSQQRFTSDGNLEYVYDVIEPKELKKLYNRIIINYPVISGRGCGSVKLLGKDEKTLKHLPAEFTQQDQILFASIKTGSETEHKTVDASKADTIEKKEVKCTEESLHNASRVDLQKFAKTLGGFQKIVSMGNITEASEKYLLELSRKYHQDEEAKKKIAETINIVASNEEFKKLADENQKVDMLRKELHIKGINADSKA